MPRPALCLALLLPALAGCADLPALEGRVSADIAAAPYPAITPLGPILARADALAVSGRASPAALAPVEARLAALRARADALRGPVIPPAQRARLLRGVAADALQ
ncbi:MAG: hypothetical protein HLUCCA08_11745 [Rhodobacteraceae bacterium HLUCCA08]|nr:MAG: hypothetical protein HLUCCA08_11745 [Rhodobacteraceae bacterium HLUCCA08]